ncbi:MAG: hypothetical protein RMI63_08900 [Caldimicrobium sp.]|nr:hypothetical protein [Caldimicrobium sp.]
MATSNYRELLRKLLTKNLTQEEYQNLENILQRIIKKSLRYSKSSDLEVRLKKVYSTDYLKELTKDLLVRLFENKDTLLRCKEIKESYLVRMAKNILLFKVATAETKIRSLSLQELSSTLSDSRRDNPLERALNLSYEVDFLEGFFIEDCLKGLKKHLTKKELETLCFYIRKILENEEQVVSKRELAVHYKRWERLKPKLREVLPRDIDTLSKVHLQLFERILSEICSEFNL